MLWEIALPSDQLAKLYCAPDALVCGDCAVIVWLEPGTSNPNCGAGANLPPSRLTSRFGGEVWSITFTAGGALVSAKFAVAATPDTEAVTLYGPPGVWLAVNDGVVAIPTEFVTPVATLEEPANVPLEPEPGAANVMGTPGDG